MEATEINTKLLERLSDYVDDKYTGDVLCHQLIPVLAPYRN